VIGLVKRPLHWLRAVLAEAAAATVERWPGLEPRFVAAGRGMARRSRVGGGLYGVAQEALMKRLRSSGNRYREVAIKGLPMVVDITDGTGRHPFFYAMPYEKAVTDAVITALKPGDVFLDVGAHLGYFSALAARVVGPSGRVIAFEPHADARVALAAMLERNQVATIVEIVPVALADRRENVVLYTNPDHPSHSTIEPERSRMRTAITFRPGPSVSAVTLDDWLAERPAIASRVRGIKIDVGGGEARVLAGMTETLRPLGLTIICDTTIGGDADDLLGRAGFQRHRIERGTQPFGHFLYVRPRRLTAVNGATV
jgi:FkbM family methyltransferase